MVVIPAIDLKGGRCVRLIQGRMDRETVYSEDPVAVARRWVAEGAERLHVVDLDGAVEGKMRHQTIIAQIVRIAQIPVQVGGGIRGLATAEALIALGAARVILGTAALEDRALLEKTTAALPGRILVGIDAKEGRVAVRGWVTTSDRPAVDFAREVATLPLGGIIYTDIARDGMLVGPNLSAIREMVAAVSPRCGVIASGGVSSLQDIQALAASGVEGIIIGKALYAGTFSLAEAIRAARGTG